MDDIYKKVERIFHDRLLYLTDEDLRNEAHSLPVNRINYTHIKHSPKLYEQANAVILNVIRDGEIQTLLMKNRYGLSGTINFEAKRHG